MRRNRHEPRAISRPATLKNVIGGAVTRGDAAERAESLLQYDKYCHQNQREI